jgi:hypothetical protein
VAYLPQAQAQAVANQADSQSRQFLQFLIQHGPGTAAPAAEIWRGMASSVGNLWLPRLTGVLDLCVLCAKLVGP